jgi:hypothetical protein
MAGEWAAKGSLSSWALKDLRTAASALSSSLCTLSNLAFRRVLQGQQRVHTTTGTLVTAKSHCQRQT